MRFEIHLKCGILDIIKELFIGIIMIEAKEKDLNEDIDIENINYNSISREISKAINQNLWLKIKYKNKSDQITSFMVGINDINYRLELFDIDSFNIMYNESTEGRQIYYSGILSAEAIEGTYHVTPKKLLDNIAKYPESYAFLQYNMDRDDILDYYEECFKLDNVPYKSQYGLVKGIDNDTILENDKYQLSEDQFNELSLALMNKKDKKKNNKIENILALNRLSIETDKGLYVLAYRELKLDIKNKCLIPSKETIINREFSFDSSNAESKNIYSISKFIPEDALNILENFDANEQKIHNIIQDYNNNANKPYKNILDSKPYIVYLAKNIIVDIREQFNGIREMISNPETMSIPIDTFFGNPNPKNVRKINYPIYVVDDKYNIDQINAIDGAMKSAASYVQGPPGTGKTQTLLNLILTIYYNDKTALVTSNNNIPMDGVFEDIKSLNYKENVPLLFPAIRIGNSDSINEALDYINEMIKRASGLKADENAIQNIKNERKAAMRGLTDLLEKYEHQQELLSKIEAINALIEKTKDEWMKIRLDAQIAEVKKELNELGHIEVDDDKLKELMNIDFRRLFMSIHFDTVQRLKKINRNKYSTLKDILQMPVETDDDKNRRIKAFKDYLIDDSNLKAFQEIFPIIITTNMSATYLGSPKTQFDYVLMDEAGQCNIANALISILRGERIVLVGDPQQLRPVVVLDPNINKKLMDKFRVADEYNYINNSIYTTFATIDVINKETLLSYHYRCNDKIIAFCNKKYYNNRLKLRSKSRESNPLILLDTSIDDEKNNEPLKNVSNIEAQKIVEYVKEHPNEDIGVITPFVHQKDCIEYYLKVNGIQNVNVGTVHAFQGDQKNVILFSTAITKNTYEKTYEWLKNNRELINVAISRSKDKLVVLGSLNAVKKLSKGVDDMRELFDYVKTNGQCNVTNVSPKSEALGTREISSKSENDFKETIDQLFSVISTQCYVRQEVEMKNVFKNDTTINRLYFTQSFDFVIYERAFNYNKIVAIIELNGPEHRSRQDVIERDNYKKKMCEKHNIKLLFIPRECARDYTQLKITLKGILNSNK